MTVGPEVKATEAGLWPASPGPTSRSTASAGPFAEARERAGEGGCRLNRRVPSGRGRPGGREKRVRPPQGRPRPDLPTVKSGKRRRPA